MIFYLTLQNIHKKIYNFNKTNYVLYNNFMNPIGFKNRVGVTGKYDKHF